MLYCGISDIGRKRAVNQDYFSVREYGDGVFLAVVCDGMGGVIGGGVASFLAAKAFVEKIDSFFNPEDKRNLKINAKGAKKLLTEAVNAANAVVYARSGENPALKGMGTTLVASLVTSDTIYTVNIGDSRMYFIDGEAIVQITRDHSYVQYLVDIGKITSEEARKSLNRNIITRAVGTEATVESDIYITDISDLNKTEGHTSCILLCTDGLTNHISMNEIAGTVSGCENTEKGVAETARLLVDRANELGGSDNITAVLASFAIRKE